MSLGDEKEPSSGALDALIDSRIEGDMRPKDVARLFVAYGQGKITHERIAKVAKRNYKRELSPQHLDALIFRRYSRARNPDSFVFQQYGVLNLYRDDIQKVIKLLEKHPCKPEIVIDDYRIRDVREVVTIRKRKTNYLSIVSKSPYIALELRRDSAILFADDIGTPDLLDLVTELHDLLLSRQGLHLPYAFLLLLIPGITIDQVLPRVRDLVSIRTYNVIGLICLLAVIYTFVSEFRWRSRHCTIHLYNAPDTWLERNKEKILIGALTALLSFLIVTVVPQFVTWLVNTLPK